MQVFIGLGADLMLEKGLKMAFSDFFSIFQPASSRTFTFLLLTLPATSRCKATWATCRFTETQGDEEIKVGVLLIPSAGQVAKHEHYVG